MKLEIKKLKKYTDKTGSLVPFYSKKGFKIKRFFFLYGNKKYLRADHAHKKCNQIIIPVCGASKVQIINKKREVFNFLLSDKNRKILVIPKFHWIKIKFTQKKSVLLTLCDYKYDKKEYIQNIKNL